MRVQEPCAVLDNKIGFLIHCTENIHYTTLTVDMHAETRSSHIVQRWIVYIRRCVKHSLHTKAVP